MKSVVVLAAWSLATAVNCCCDLLLWRVCGCWCYLSSCPQCIGVQLLYLSHFCLFSSSVLASCFSTWHHSSFDLKNGFQMLLTASFLSCMTCKQCYTNFLFDLLLWCIMWTGVYSFLFNSFASSHHQSYFFMLQIILLLPFSFGRFLITAGCVNHALVMYRYFVYTLKCLIFSCTVPYYSVSCVICASSYYSTVLYFL